MIIVLVSFSALAEKLNPSIELKSEASNLRTTCVDSAKDLMEASTMTEELEFLKKASEAESELEDIIAGMSAFIVNFDSEENDIRLARIIKGDTIDHLKECRKFRRIAE